jgi:SRSO17 transposase
MENAAEILLRKLDEECGGISGLFGRKDARATARDFLYALLSKAERKNGWQLSEAMGRTGPHRFQNFIANAQWDADALRDHNAKRAFGFLGGGGTLILDETGFLKKGRMSAGVKRQYSGTAGRIENCQIGVFAAYRTPLGHALVDRELYVPQEWIADAERCAKARIPPERPFYTKPQLATQMVSRALENGADIRWVTADEAYGGDPEFRRNLEGKKLSYVLAVPRDTYVRVGLRNRKAEECVAEAEFARMSCGSGSKGERLYDWAFVKRDELCPAGHARYLLVRRSVSDKDDVAFFVAFCKEGTERQEVVSAAGERWSIEECFETAKGETGLDHYEVLSFVGWNRHVALSMFALTVLRGAQTALADIPPENVGSMDAFKKKRNL